MAVLQWRVTLICRGESAFPGREDPSEKVHAQAGGAQRADHE
jgi:hypothetical protein